MRGVSRRLARPAALLALLTLLVAQGAFAADRGDGWLRALQHAKHVIAKLFDALGGPPA